MNRFLTNGGEAREESERPRVLVVDDDRNMCLILHDILEESGYEVEERNRGRDALELLARGPFDVVLVDVVMPDLDGIDILKAIKGKRPDTEVILVTGHASLDTAIAAMNDGAYSYVVKPVDPQRLVHLVSRAVEKRRLLVERRRLLETSERQAALLGMINEIARAVTSTLDFDKILEILSRETRKVISYDCFCINLLDETLERARLVHLDPAGASICDVIPLCPKTRLKHEQIAEIKRSVLNDLEAEALSGEGLQLLKAGIRSRVVFPLVAGGKVIGSLEMASKLKGAFSPEAVSTLEKLLDQIAAALDHAQLYRRAQAEAVTDPLTRLYNRRHFFEVLNSELQRARRYHTTFSLLILDLDHFKAYNDRFGHLAGDQALMAVSSIVRRTCRATDVPARYGGDELAVMLLGTDLEQAAVFAGRLRDSVEKARIQADKGSEPMAITVSVGVAGYRAGIRDSDELIVLADRALYEAKRMGRNSIFVQS